LKKPGPVFDYDASAMDAQSIIALIRRRREAFFDSQISGTASDPLVATGADVSRAIADEYDSLLAEIENT
jgi:hypothetical protein